jgi:hypothetical protein
MQEIIHQFKQRIYGTTIDFLSGHESFETVQSQVSTKTERRMLADQTQLFENNLDFSWQIWMIFSILSFKIIMTTN